MDQTYNSMCQIIDISYILEVMKEKDARFCQFILLRGMQHSWLILEDQQFVYI